MLYNSDGLSVIFMVYQKVYIFMSLLVTFYQYLPYFQNKNYNRKNMQYENNLRKMCFTEREREKKKGFGFQKSLFPKGTSRKRGGRLIIRVILYSVNTVTINYR